MSLKGIAKATLSILDAGGYTTDSGVSVEFARELDQAVSGTRLYTPAELQTLLDQPSGIAGSGIVSRPQIEVCNESTQAAARRLVQDEGVSDLVLLNFASARNAGGGFLNGAKAQEEDLSRCSGLYPCLLTQPRYYEENRSERSLIYTDHMIHSPGVPWFRVKSGSLLDSYFLASVITAPAPNAGEVLRREPGAGAEIESRLRRRCGFVLSVARDQHHRTLLLGAWGCGVFRNQPAMVADAFGTWLEDAAFGGAFDRVVFAVLDRTRKGDTFDAFWARFPP